ncbi:heparin lyase I family protein [Verrucomicrobium spinosum]|uniref:heparin lyase I family protein n=2 Tax=Verrucomicrobium spinosum TaxID=2736 RepID=UPI0002E8AE08|nr:heparin lyase I family protein [Verrucomicrobium spinosum]
MSVSDPMRLFQDHTSGACRGKGTWILHLTRNCIAKLQSKVLTPFATAINMLRRGAPGWGTLGIWGLASISAMAETESVTGYETGQQNDNDIYIGVVEPRPESVVASQNYARWGMWSLRSELNYGETTDVGIRAECNQRLLRSSAGSTIPMVQRGVRRFYGFSVLLDPQPGNYEYDSTSEVIMQQKHANGGAVFQLLTDENWFKCWTQNHDGVRRRTNIMTFQRGIWYDFVFEHLPSYMGSGEIRLYCKKASESTYVKRLQWIGPTLSMNKDGYWKWGMYKANWTNPTGSSKRVIYHDNIKVGATFAEADPSIMLPAGWSTRNVGSVGAPGYATAIGSVFTLRGSGMGVDSTSDGFRYALQTLSGDGEITARLVSMSNHGNPLAGIMVRETAAAGSKYHFFGRNIGGVMNTKHRASTGGGVSTTILGTSAAPTWVRIARVGNVLTAYKSTDGTTWTGASSQTISMTGEITVGLMTTSRHATAATTAVFDNVTVVP